jgi:Ankyrin repeat
MYVRYEFHPLVSALIDESAQGLRHLAALLQVYSVHHTIRHDPRFGPYDYGDHNAQQLPIFWVICAPSFKLEWMIPRLRILLEHGAELNVFHNSLRITPLHFVMTCRPYRDDEESARLTIARFLVKNGADLNLPFPTLLPYIPCQTLCDCITLTFSAEVILCLLEIGTNPNQCDKNGLTALILAVREGHDNSAYELLHYGANPLMRTDTRESLFLPGDSYNDISPMELACASGSHCVLELLLDSIPTHQCTAQLLQRPLYLVCANGPLRLVDLCLNCIPTEHRGIPLLQGALYVASKMSKSTLSISW